MTKLEHFKQWALQHCPNSSQSGVEVDERYVFNSYRMQLMWQAFQHAFTVRPTTNTRLNSAEFMKDNPATIVDRLNGIFPTADPPYKMTPLHYEAAREIERLRGMLGGATPLYDKYGQWWVLKGEYSDHDVFACKQCADIFRVSIYGVPLPEECPTCAANAINKKPAEAG